MPNFKTIQRAKLAKRQGKAPSTQAGEFVKQEIEHLRSGKHGARSTKQAIAIGLSKARRAGVRLGIPKGGSEELRRKARRDTEVAKSPKHAVSRTRSRAISDVLRHEGRSAASAQDLARQARSAARARDPDERSAAARKAARTKGPAGRSTAAKKAARTRRGTTARRKSS